MRKFKDLLIYQYDNIENLEDQLRKFKGCLEFQTHVNVLNGKLIYTVFVIRYEDNDC